MKKLLLKLFAVVFFLCPSSAFAGSGYYLGADLTRNYAKTESQSSASIAGITEVKNDHKSKVSNDPALRFGYKHKISEHGYIAPEFFYSKINGDYLYSTTMKAGIEVADFSFFASLGYTENNKFNGSSENYGLGLEYKIDDNFSISSEYIKYGNVKFNETSIADTVTTNIQKNQQLQTFKIGITYYFHE
jgi:opacity protein-like surface antigen